MTNCQFSSGARYLEIGSWQLEIGYSLLNDPCHFMWQVSKQWLKNRIIKTKIIRQNKRKMKMQSKILVLSVAALLITGGCRAKKELEVSEAAVNGLKKQVELLQWEMKTQEKKLEKTQSIAKDAQFQEQEDNAKIKVLQKKLADSYKEREGKVQKFLQEIGLNQRSITEKEKQIGILKKEITERNKQIADLKKELSVVREQLTEKTGQVIDLKAKLKNAETRDTKSE